MGDVGHEYVGCRSATAEALQTEGTEGFETVPQAHEIVRLSREEFLQQIQTEVLQKLSTDVAQLLTVSGSESDSVLQKRAEAVRKRAHLAAEMQRVVLKH